MAAKDGLVTVEGDRELINQLKIVSSRVGMALSAAIKDALAPLEEPMKAAAVAVIDGKKESSSHWSTSETDGKERKTKSGKVVKTPSSGELIRMVKADPKLLGKAKYRNQFAKDGTLQVSGSTGMLARSIIVKARAAKAKKMLVGGKEKRVSQSKAWGRVGPSNIKMVAMSAWTKKPITVCPTRYSHLVEKGHTLKIGKKILGKVAGRPFVNPLLAASIGAIQARVRHRLALEIDKAAQSKGSN